MIRKVFSLQHDFHILIIDDGSPDGTAGIVKSLQKEYDSKLFILERKGKLGLGTAYIAGFRWALERSYEYIFEMDCDFSHNPDDLIRLHDEKAHEYPTTADYFINELARRQAARQGRQMLILTWVIAGLTASSLAAVVVSLSSG